MFETLKDNNWYHYCVQRFYCKSW